MAYLAYVVFRGRGPGVYTSWHATHAQIDGYRGAVYRGYESIELAHRAYSEYMRSDVLHPLPLQPLVPPTLQVPQLHDAYLPRGDPWSRFRTVCYMFMAFYVIVVLLRCFG